MFTRPERLAKHGIWGVRALVKRVEIGKEDVRVVYKIGQLPFVHGPASGASWQDCLRRALTLVVERTARRLGQGVGKPWAAIRALCG